MCHILNAVLKTQINKLDKPSSPTNVLVDSEGLTMKSVEVTDAMEAIFISSLYSSLGAALEGHSRLVFDEFVKKISGFVKVDDSPSKRATFSKIYNPLPQDKL